MKELYAEGLVTHGDPESCGEPSKEEKGGTRSVDRGTRKQGVEPRNKPVRSADAVNPSEKHLGNTGVRVKMTSASSARAVEDPMRTWNLHAREPGDPLATRRVAPRVAKGRHESARSRR